MYNFGWYASGYRGIATLAPYAPIRSQQRQKQRKAKIPHTHWLPCQMVSSKPFGFAAAVPHGDRNFLLSRPSPIGFPPFSTRLVPGRRASFEARRRKAPTVREYPIHGL